MACFSSEKVSRAIRGRPLTMAALGWLVSFAICLAAGFGLQGCGLVGSGLTVGAALTTTALGTLMPILRDADELPTRFGAYAVAAGAMGEFESIILIATPLGRLPLGRSCASKHAHGADADDHDKGQHDRVLDGHLALFVSEEICPLLDDGTHEFSPVTGYRIPTPREV